jgi:MGT family glycosyltransferase
MVVGAVNAAKSLLARSFRREVNVLRERYGLAPLTVAVTEYAGRMPLYVVPTTPEFDYERRDLPSSVHYVGPCLWDQGGAEPPAWLLEMPHDQPWVHVTEGTMHTQEPILLRTAARALGGRPMHVIMTAGDRRDPATLDLGPRAANVRVERWLSHKYLFPRTDVVVTTGGAGTVMTALEAGVPLVVVPTEWDKPENAQRVVEAGAGLRLSPGRLTPARLRAAVERVLGEPSFRMNARRLAASFARYQGPVRVAELLEELGGGPPGPTEVTGRVLFTEETLS